MATISEYTPLWWMVPIGGLDGAKLSSYNRQHL